MLLAIASELSVLCVVSLPIIHPYYHYPSSIHTVESEHPGVGGAVAHAGSPHSTAKSSLHRVRRAQPRKATQSLVSPCGMCLCGGVDTDNRAGHHACNTPERTKPSCGARH